MELFKEGDSVYWNQRINWRVRRMRGVVKKVEKDYLTIAPHENSHESYWKRYFRHGKLRFHKSHSLKKLTEKGIDNTL